MHKNSLLLILMLSIFCLTPAYACTNCTDLTTYTSAGNYITPAYGTFLDSRYGYFVNSASFLIEGENFESNGYYHIYNTNNYELLVNLSGVIQATANGNLFICVNDGNGDEVCQQIGRYNGASIFGNAEQSFQGTFNLQSAGSREGLLDFWIRLNYDIGGNSDSYHYRGYFDIDKAYGKRRNVLITSTNNLSSGVVTITLNSTITNEFNPIDVIYDNDGNELTLSGTSSTIIFTDDSKTKVYPFYIESFKGGFYNFSRNTTNTTVIKIFINENTTGKTLLMYYNYNTSLGKLILDGEYNFYNRTDFNNNPFAIHQVYNDFRWNGTFFRNSIYALNAATTYTRNTGFGGTVLVNNSKIAQLNNLTQFSANITDNTGFIFATGNFIKSNISSTYTFSGARSSNTQRCNLTILNSSGTELSFSTSGCGTVQRKYVLYPNNTFCDVTNNKCLPESKTYFSFYQFDQSSATSGNIGNFSTIFTAITTNTISNVTNTTYLNAAIGLTNNGQTTTYISEFPYYGNVNSQDAGYVSCFGADNLNNTFFQGSVNIPAEVNLANHNFILPYKITNMTYFFDTNVTSINYYCCFYSGTNSICSNNLTMNIGNQRLFVNNILPESYGIYAVNNVPFSIYYDYSFNFSATSVTAVNVSTLNCINFKNGVCYNWNIVSTSQVAYLNTTTSWTDTCQNCNGCYIASYVVKVSDTPLSTIAARLFCTSGFNPNNTNQDNAAQQTNQTYNQMINNSINGILGFGSGCASNNQTCLRRALFNNPILGLDYIVMTVISTIAGAMNVNIFYITLFNSIVYLIGNYYTITLALILIALLALGNHNHGHYIALGVGFITFTFFCFMGWTGIPFWMWIGLILAAGILYMIRRNGQ